MLDTAYWNDVSEILQLVEINHLIIASGLFHFHGTMDFKGNKRLFLLFSNIPVFQL